MLGFHEQNSVSNFFTKPRLANSFIRFQLTTRTVATRCISTRATLSPRIIRGDKVLLAEIQLVTALRVREKLTFKTHSKPLPHKEKRPPACKLEKPLPKANSRREQPGTKLLPGRICDM